MLPLPRLQQKTCNGRPTTTTRPSCPQEASGWWAMPQTGVGPGPWLPASGRQWCRCILPGTMGGGRPCRKTCAPTPNSAAWCHPSLKPCRAVDRQVPGGASECTWRQRPQTGKTALSSVGINHQPDNHAVQAGHVAERCGAAQQEQRRGDEEEEPRCRWLLGRGWRQRLHREGRRHHDAAPPPPILVLSLSWCSDSGGRGMGVLLDMMDNEQTTNKCWQMIAFGNGVLMLCPYQPPPKDTIPQSIWRRKQRPWMQLSWGGQWQ